MLSLFPQILFLAPLSITLLRVVTALYFGYIAWHLVRKQDEIAHTPMPLVGMPKIWMVTFSAVVVGAIGISLFVGTWSQASALLGAIVVLKHLIFYKRFVALLPFSKSTYILLFCICLTLVVSGAGAFAFDLPL